MEEFNKYTATVDKAVYGGLIAISVIILTVWFTTGTPDVFSEVSFYLLVVSLPFLVTDFFLCQMPHLQFSNKVYGFFINHTAPLTGRTAIFGVGFAIMHISAIAGILFLLICYLCFILFMNTLHKTEKSLKLEQKKLAEQKLQ